MSSKRRLSFWLVVSIGSGLLTAAFFEVAKQSHFWLSTLHQSRISLTDQDLASARQQLGPFEDQSFQTSDHLTLRAWYVPPLSRGTIVFVHGGYNNRASFLPVAAALVQAGHGVLLYDSRGAGQSDEGLTTWGDHEQRDLKAALDFLETREGPAGDCVGVLGFSIGASTAAMVAANDQRVSALLLNAVWSSLAGEVAYKSQHYGALAAWLVRGEFLLRGVDMDHVTPLDSIGRFSPRPLLMIAGDADTDTPPAVFRSVFAAAREPKDLWIIPGAHHGDYVQIAGDRYLKRVVGFFSDHLCRRSR
ncbi:MAG: alpha/beta fold hydrolase [Proteobacteria bacterium]|nr:alpha/beta fold hydrolase [Pseudomonadota bacterium]